MKKRDLILNLFAIVLLGIFLFYVKENVGSYETRILNLCAINAILAMSMNLINGFTGLFSLGHAGFMAVGAYTSALLTMSTNDKLATFYMTPLISPLDKVTVPFFVAIIAAGIMAAIVGWLIGYPALRLKGDYLAVATLGFGEIIRIVFTNTQNITNGALGIKSIPITTNLWWSFGLALVTLFVLVSLINSSFGRALKAIREDEIAAEAMGIGLAKLKTLSFVIGAFFAGIGGALLGNLIGSIEPKQFTFLLTFNILLIIVLGGMGSITGSIISSFIVTIGMEWLRFLDEPLNLGFMVTVAKPGIRMVVFSALLVLCVIFFSRGIMGTREITWDGIFGLFKRKKKAKGGIS